MFSVIEACKNCTSKKKDSFAATRLVLKNFDLLCDDVRSGVGNENEQATLMSLMRQHVDIKHERELSSNLKLDKLNSQLA